MTRTVWTAAVLVAAIATGAMLFSQPQLSEADAPPPATTPAPLGDVKVRHDLVVVPLAVPIEKSGPRSPRQASSVSASASGRADFTGRARQTPPAAAPLLAKVRRAVAGDGRYRPEPFPRVR